MDGGTLRTVGKPASQLAGRTFGFLRAIAKIPLQTRDGHAYWLCYCHGCGSFTCVSSHVLSLNRKATCGCFRYCAAEAVYSQHRRMGRVLSGQRMQAQRWAHKRKLTSGKERHVQP